MLGTYRDDDQSLERAIKVSRRLRNTDVPAFQDTFGWLLFRSGDISEALTYMEPAAKVLSGDPIVQYHLGKIYAALDRDAEALESFKTAVSIAGTADPTEQIKDAMLEIERLSGGSGE